MAVREFNGTTNDIVHSIGGLSGCTFGTFAAMFKTDTIVPWQAILALHTTANDYLAALNLVQTTGLINWNSEVGGNSSGPALSTGIWYLTVFRKATGSATPRFSVYNMNTPGWTHAAGSAALLNWAAPGASGSIRQTFQGTDDLFDGRMAVRAAWSNEVHWTADASGDTAIEGAGLETSLQNWVDEAPTALWPYNQDPLSAVDDLVGTSNQSSVTGTTVITGDEPPGFSFDLGPPAPAPNLFLTRNLQNR